MDFTNLKIDFNWQPNPLISNLLTDLKNALIELSKDKIVSNYNIYNYQPNNKKCLRHYELWINSKTYRLYPIKLFEIIYEEDDNIISCNLIIYNYNPYNNSEIIKSYKELNSTNEQELKEKIIKVINNNIKENKYWINSLNQHYNI